VCILPLSGHDVLEVGGVGSTYFSLPLIVSGYHWRVRGGETMFSQAQQDLEFPRDSLGYQFDCESLAAHKIQYACPKSGVGVVANMLSLPLIASG
jgi:hypothetical protein